ncbi:12501_t:CDS:1, partial [Ambispora gerdemannii]
SVSSNLMSSPFSYPFPLPFSPLPLSLPCPVLIDHSKDLLRQVGLQL